MDIDTTRRALVAAIVGGGAVGGSLSPVRGYLDRFAPFSGSAWRDATDRTNRRVESPYGPATVRYDDYGTAHVETGDGGSSGEKALYFAVGYAQAADRLFQMDLQRRVMRGDLSEVVGERALDSDEFHVKMDFVGGAEANLELLDGTPTGEAVEAFAEGVNACREREALPLEFGLLDYEPDPWTPTDTMLMEQQISWGLTGSFWTLRRERLARKLSEDAVDELYPFRMDHDSPIVRSDSDGANDGGTDAAQTRESRRTVTPSGEFEGGDLLDWLSAFESPPGVGSNSWVVSGGQTASGSPIVANDPHLSLMAPPVWYEMNLRTDDVSVRGVTFPGVPFVVIGENDSGAWGFTNSGADVIDFYSYETDESGDRYRYEGEWREFETEEKTITVSDGDDRTVTVRKTVHGPLLEREGQRVGVSWTGHTATRTSAAIREYSETEGVEDFLAATEKMDLPTQNVVYADREGNTLFYVTGKIPIRTIDGEEVWGTRVFDGSAGEAEWEGFQPFGVSSWEGFVPFDEKPHVRNPDYLGTANQRITDDPQHYVGERYATPYRGQRLYELLDRRADSEKPMDPAFMRRIQRDAKSARAEQVVDELVAAAEGEDGLGGVVSTLRDWDGRMVRDSRAALVFRTWFERFREATFGDEFEAAGLDESYYPNDLVLATLPADSRWFGDEGRAAVMVRALRDALDDIEDGATYGDYNTTAAVTHPFDQPFLNYPAYPTDGSANTLNNYRKESAVGSSWRQVCPMAEREQSVCVLPGGNSGEYFSDHYHDQLRLWADGKYKPMSREIRGETAITFEATDSEGDR
ncbi:penicillin acylase family protein [Halorussus gelatinilyticus]|uniref:Penicillin acylase family protein n=1 Tax=Halorussus gelatinilyticus TaxID=2937524 RepID=A0A8U0IGH1_9EURY|nr:penicillin acylase family protein [Halorussus gelatinilyticus]UPW00083.1 penicillin acylase family protein [Halorussus gelatinilyticus]